MRRKFTCRPLCAKLAKTCASTAIGLVLLTLLMSPSAFAQQDSDDFDFPQPPGCTTTGLNQELAILRDTDADNIGDTDVGAGPVVVGETIYFEYTVSRLGTNCATVIERDGNAPDTAVTLITPDGVTHDIAPADTVCVGCTDPDTPDSHTFEQVSYLVDCDDEVSGLLEANAFVGPSTEVEDDGVALAAAGRLRVVAVQTGQAVGCAICEVSINIAKRCDLAGAFIDDQLVTNNDDTTLGCTSIDGLDIQHFTEVANTGEVALTACEYNMGDLAAELAVEGTDTTEIANQECSAAEGTMTASVTCECGDTGITTTATDSAQIDCVDCDGNVEKTVACGDGEFGEFCLSWLDSEDTDAENVAVKVEAEDNSESGASLVNCVLEDDNIIFDANIGGEVSVPDDLGTIGDYEQLCTQALVDAEPPGGDTATLTCECQVDGTDIVKTDGYVFTDTADFDCQAAGVMLSKECFPQGQMDVAPNQNKVLVTVSNVGDQDENTADANLINCVVTDTLARDDDQCANVDEDVPLTNTVSQDDFDLTAGASEEFMSVIGDNVPAGDVELTLTSCNEATVTCNIDDGTGNPVMDGENPKEVTRTVTDPCEVQTGCFPHTIGFWSNRSAFVEAAGEIMVCGQTLDGFEEVSDLLCDRGQEILNAQCAAAALNQAASNSEAGGGSCMPGADGAVGSLLAVCCASNGEGGCAPAPDGLTMEQCITQVTEFNEDEPTLDCFALGLDADFCNPGRNGPDSCPPPGQAKKPNGNNNR